MFLDAANGVLVSADALWENGFGIVFPELVGESGFDDVGAVLDHIGRLPVKLVIPGHGAPFTDVGAALQRGRSRLRGFAADPPRHARHAVKVLIKYHLMEERRVAMPVLLQWTVDTPLLRGLWERYGRHESESPAQWAERFVGELVKSGALGIEDGGVVDR